jgi:hypothetical protein
MQRALTIALASAAIAFAAPASAAVTVTTTNGTPLDYAIHASQTDDQNNQTEVFGTIQQGGQGADVSFVGDTNIHITDGGGYAQINDSDFDSKDASTQDWFSLIINPDIDFTAIKFSIQLVDDGTISIYSLLSGQDPTNPANFTFVDSFDQKGNQNNNYLLSGDAFNAMKIVVDGTSLFEVKQNSINAAPGAVPEPGTWALMLLGFGGIGMTMRRRRRSSATLMQVA